MTNTLTQDPSQHDNSTLTAISTMIAGLFAAIGAWLMTKAGRVKRPLDTTQLSVRDYSTLRNDLLTSLRSEDQVDQLKIATDTLNRITNDLAVQLVSLRTRQHEVDLKLAAYDIQIRALRQQLNSNSGTD